MERLKQRVRPVSWWSLGFLMLITSLLLSVFVAPLARAADDTYSVTDGKITIQSGSFYGGTYTDGNADPKVQCSPTPSVSATVVINQADKTQIQNGETPDVIRYSITPNGGANNSSCPSGERTAQYATAPQREGINSLSEDSSCNIDGFGWLICKPSQWIGDAMDWIYHTILENFLETKPFETINSTDITFKAWDIIRGFANAIFIIAFIIIIYSQITSVGISNYGIKKLAPRLIIAAILVNLSYYISALGVDLSNIIGHGVKDFLDNILSSVLDGAEVHLETGELIAKTLSGGAFAYGTVLLVHGGLFAAAPLILPTLLMLFLSGLVAIFILSVRQALIIVLIIISPLAFVAYLLPGTEKLFEKWRNIFITMLVFFPAFAFVFGGANLAGTIISMTAGDSVIRLVLGWIVQFAPLAITPLIMKLGGGFLSKITAIVNDPTKGLIDRSKQWADKQSKRIGYERTFGNDKLGKFSGLRKIARHRYQKGRAMDDRVANAEKAADNLYHDSDAYKRLNLAARQHADKESELNLQAENRYDEMKAGFVPKDIGNLSARQSGQLTKQAAQIQATYSSIAAEGFRKANAQRELNAQFAEEVLKNESLQKQAGGNVYEGGAQAAMAAAVATKKADVAKTIEEGQKLLQHFELSAEQIHQHALGEKPFIDPTTGKATYTITNKDGHSYTFDPAESNLTHEAAIDTKFKTGTVAEIAEIIAKYPSEDRMSVAAGLAASSIKNKAPFLGGRLVNEITKNTVNSQATLDDFIVNTWAKGEKWSSVDLASMDSDATTLLMNAIKSVGIDKDTKETLQMRILEMQDDPDLYSRVTEKARKGFEDILNL